MTVLVTGARGKTGRHVLARLATGTDQVVRAGSQTPSAIAGPVEPVLFTWGRTDSWATATSDVDTIYLVRPDIPDAPERIAALLSLAPGAHVVLLSEQGADTLPEGSWERRVEAAVVSNAKNWTILRPSWFQQVLIDERFYLHAIRDDRVFSMPSGGASIAWIDTRDIADVAVAALLAPDRYAGVKVTLTGPAAISLRRVTDWLSTVVGQRVVADEGSVEDAVAGLDPWLATIIGGVYDRVRAGTFGGTTGEVDRITGHPPRTIEDFIVEHAALWRETA